MHAWDTRVHALARFRRCAQIVRALHADNGIRKVDRLPLLPGFAGAAAAAMRFGVSVPGTFTTNSTQQQQQQHPNGWVLQLDGDGGAHSERVYSGRRRRRSDWE